MKENTSGKLTILEIADKLRELTEQYGVDSEGGKDLILCESIPVYPTIFGELEQLFVTLIRTYVGQVFLTDKDLSYVISLGEDDFIPGKPMLIYENILFRELNGPGCSEVGPCEDLEADDLQPILDVAMETVKQNNA